MSIKKCFVDRLYPIMKKMILLIVISSVKIRGVILAEIMFQTFV